MFIVKQSRKVTIESFEKRSRKDLKRTTDNLSLVAAEIYKQNLLNLSYNKSWISRIFAVASVLFWETYFQANFI